MAINKNKIIALADKHIAKQNYAKALNELKKLVNETPNDINLLNKMGDLYSKTNDKENAKQCFMKVAASYQSSGFSLKAIAVYKKIIRLDDRFHDARDRLVQLYIQQGHIPEAKGELRRMAELFVGDNEPVKALACYEKMVEIDPTNLDARIKIADILLKQGRLDSAAEQYVHMGRDLLEKNMLNEARKIVDKGMKISARNVDLRVLDAQLQVADGQADEALKTLGEIIRQDPQHKAAIRALGQLYIQREQYKDALALFQKLFRLDNSESKHLEEIGRKLIENDQLDQAFEAFSPVAERFLIEQKHDDATRLYRSILYKDEDHLRAQEKLVDIYRRSGQTDNAVLGLEKLIRQCLVSDDPKLAVPYLEQVLDLKPDHPEWKAKLVELGGAADEEDVADVEAADEEFENTDIHVFDDSDQDALPRQDILSESGNHQSVSSVIEESAAEGDTQARIDKHLTESEFLIKYGMLDKAQEHLMAVKELEILNVQANTLLKDIFMRQGQIDMAVACQICLINVCIDDAEYDRAREIIEEIREHRPEVAEMQDDRLANLASATGDNDPSAPQAVVEGTDASDVSAELVFDQASQDVVDFQNLNESKPHTDIDGLPESAIDEGWSLEMPESVLAQDGQGVSGGASEDLRDMFQMDDPDEPDDAGETDDGLLAAAESLTEDRADTPAEAAGDPAAGDPAAGDPAAGKSPSKETAIPDDPFAGDDDEPLLMDEEIAEEVPEDSAEDAPAAVDSDTLEPDQVAQVAPEPAAVEDADSDASQPAPLGSQQGSLGGELEEIDFFISVEAFDDARNLIEEALTRFGEHPMLQERMQEVEAKTQASEAEAQPVPKPAEPETDPSSEEGFAEDGFFDLAAELNDELFDDGEGDVNDNTSQEDIQSVEELFQEFKRGVEEQIDENDHQTHYDLGIAYKEMGLLEEAIGEFEKARRDGGRFLECVTMIGNCLIELGRTEDAIAHYQNALNTDGLPEDSQKAIYYELAQGYEGLGELDKALASFRSLEKLDPNYRDLGARIEALV